MKQEGCTANPCPVKYLQYLPLFISKPETQASFNGDEAPPEAVAECTPSSVGSLLQGTKEAQKTRQELQHTKGCFNGEVPHEWISKEVLQSLRCAALADMALIYDRLKDGPPSDNSLETRSYKDEKKQ